MTTDRAGVTPYPGSETGAAPGAATAPGPLPERAPRAWDGGAQSSPSEQQPRLRFVPGPITDVQYEEMEVGESLVAFVYPELRLSYPYDDPGGKAATEITIASASCVILHAIGMTDAMCEVDDELAAISDELQASGRFPYGGSFLHVSDLTVDPYWRGGGLGPALVSFIAADCMVEAATLLPAPIRTARAGTDLTSRHYRGATAADRSAVAEAWQRAGFARIDDVPPDPDDDVDASDGPREPSSRYLVRMEDEDIYQAARVRLAAARLCARGDDVREWHDAKVRSAERASRLRAASARRAADHSKDEALDRSRDRDRAARLIDERIERIMPTAGPWRGTDTILLEGAHVQVRVSGRQAPQLRVQIVSYLPEQTEAGLDPSLGELGALVDSSWGAGARAWTVAHRPDRSTSSSSHLAAKAIVNALVDGLGLQPEAIVAAAESSVSPKPASQAEFGPLANAEGIVDDLADLELDYRDFVVTSRTSRGHYGPRDADVPAQFFVIDREIAEPGDEGDLVALAARGTASSAVIWYRFDGRRWFPDPTVPRRVRPGSGEVLRAVTGQAAQEIETDG